MTKILLTLLALTSLSSSYAESYRCHSDKGEIFLDLDMYSYDQKVTIDLSQYMQPINENEQYYSYINFLKRRRSIELAIQELKRPSEGIEEIVTNNDRFLKIHLGTSAEWAYWTLKIKLNKKKQKLTIKSYSSFIFRSKDHQDKLDCVQL